MKAENKDEDVPVVEAIEEDPRHRGEKNNSATFFVTLQDPIVNQLPAAQAWKQAQLTPKMDQSLAQTLHGSQLVEPEQSTGRGGRMSMDEVEQEYPSKEVDDEVNQLNFDDPAFNPQQVSNGNLNVQTLIEQSKHLGQPSRLKPTRPQSSRPMFR